MAALASSGIRWLGLFLRPHVERRMLLATPVVGLAMAGLAIAFAAGTGKGSSEVLFSGQSGLGPFITKQRQLHRGGAAAPPNVQGDRLRRVAERFPWRSHLPAPHVELPGERTREDDLDELVRHQVRSSRVRGRV
jgi:hypothetical protein